MEEKISIVVPVYNVEQYLKKCVESILRQTFSNIEIILVDDGSTDQSGIMCDELSKQDSRIKVIHQKNLGLSGARNTGIEVAQGRYIAFVDSDDYIAEDCIEAMLKRLLEYNADISVCGIMRFYENEKIMVDDSKSFVSVYSGVQALENNLYQRIVDNNAVAKLYKIELFENVRFPVGKLYEDLGTTYRLLDIARKVVIDTRKKYFYLQRKNSIMYKAFDHRNMDRIYISEQIVEYVQKEHPEYRAAAISRLFVASVQVLREIPLTSEYKAELELIKQNIKKCRKSVVFDKRAKKINRMIALFSFLPLGMFQKLGIIYKKVYK